MLRGWSGAIPPPGTTHAALLLAEPAPPHLTQNAGIFRGAGHKGLTPPCHPACQAPTAYLNRIYITVLTASLRYCNAKWVRRRVARTPSVNNQTGKVNNRIERGRKRASFDSFRRVMCNICLFRSCGTASAATFSPRDSRRLYNRTSTARNCCPTCDSRTSSLLNYKRPVCAGEL